MRGDSGKKGSRPSRTFIGIVKTERTGADLAAGWAGAVRLTASSAEIANKNKEIFFTASRGGFDQRDDFHTKIQAF